MKKIAPILAIALLAAGFTSCKKKYTCECKVTINGVTTTASATDTEKKSKKDAKAACDKGDVSNAAGKSECELK
jgi:hypothetical protein